MLKVVSVFVLALMLNFSSGAQKVTGVHNVKAGSLPNEYIIKTTVSGLEGVDLARIKYFISNTHSYKASSNNQFFSKVEADYIKFYIMSIPTDGVVVIELGVVLTSEGSFTFPVEFQYSKNEEKIVFKCKSLIIDNGAALLAEDPTLNEKIQAEAEKEATAGAAQQEEEARLAKIEEDKKIANDLAANKKAEEGAAALIVATQAEEVRKKKAEQETVEIDKKEEAQKLKEQQEADPLAYEKGEADALAKKEAETTALLAARKEKEENTTVSNSGVKYGVQIFALSKYTEQKVRDFCKRNNISYDKISTLDVKGITKVRYGAVGSKVEAESLKKELLSRSQINGGFVVKL